MRLTKRRRDATSQVDMTPMIDIVFLLIIFFMTVSQISAVNKERLELPKQPGENEDKPAVMTINVTENREIVLSGERMSLPRFISVVSDELIRLGDDPNRLTCIIRADERVQSGAVNEVANALKRLQIKQVRFAVEVPQ